MTLNPESILSFHEFESLFYQYLKIDKKGLFSVGKVDVWSLESFVVAFMDEWVKRIKEKIQWAKEVTEEDYSWLHQQLFKLRGFTFNEYCFLFDNAISESEFHKFPVFEFLSITSEYGDKERRNYIVNKSPTIQSYVRFLQTRDLEICQRYFERLSAPLPLDHLLKFHAYISGSTGSGKSEIMKLLHYNLQQQSLDKRKYSLIVLDPHGKFAKEVLAFDLNKAERERLVYICPRLHTDFIATLNPLEIEDTSRDNIALVSSTITAALKEMVKSDVTENMENLLVSCISTLLRKGNCSLVDLLRFMDDKNNEDLVEFGKQSPDKIQSEFFKSDFFDKSQYGRTKGALRSRLYSIVRNHITRNLFCGESTIDFEKEMNSGKVIIFNLDLGKTGDELLDVVGRFIISMICANAFRRSDIPEQERIPTFVFVDECQEIMTESVLRILSQTRKYGIHLILANQHIHQIKDAWRSEVKSSTGIKILGNNSPEHFRALVGSENSDISAFHNMPDFKFFASIKGMPLVPFYSSYELGEDESKQLSRDEIKELENYFLYESGYYRAIDDESEEDTTNNKDTPPSDDNPTPPPSTGKRNFKFKKDW